jgi:hypothetical protein
MTEDVVVVAYCWASGEIEFTPWEDSFADVPEGAIDFARGHMGVLRERIALHARHGYESETYFIPGLPEFNVNAPPDDWGRIDILMRWVSRAFSDWPTDLDNRRVQP